MDQGAGLRGQPVGASGLAKGWGVGRQGIMASLSFPTLPGEVGEGQNRPVVAVGAHRKR